MGGCEEAASFRHKDKAGYNVRETVDISVSKSFALNIKLLREMRLYSLLKQNALQTSQATKRKWFNVVTLNICCFHIFENIRES